MSERVLFVDDEPQVLEGIQRSLHKQVEIQTASGGVEALRLMEESGPFALIISDMRMPGMSGTQLLAKVREQYPDVVRMMLSGQSDLKATIEAVNEGHIYRFLNKPCAMEHLVAAIGDGLKQHRLLVAEKVLLEQTLSGCVTMLIEILGMVSPVASSRASRLQRYTVAIAAALKLPNQWQWSLSAFVSQIGCVALPGELLSKMETGQGLNDEEQRLYESHPEVAGRLIASIPRMEDVAQIVTAQFGTLNHAAEPADIRQWDVRSMGRILLRVAVEFDRLIVSGLHREAAIDYLRASKLGIPNAILGALSSVAPASRERVIREVNIKDLYAGMILHEDLVSPKGIRLVPAGHEVTRTLIVRLKIIAGGVGVVEPFRVLIPA